MGFAGNNELRSCSPAVGSNYEMTQAELAALVLDEVAEELPATMARAAAEDDQVA